MHIEKTARGELVVDTSAYASNVSAIRRHLPKGTRMMAVVKANSYGTGVGALAERCGIEILGVVDVEEAAALRRSGCTSSLMVFHLDPSQANEAVALDAEAAAGRAETIEALERAAAAAGKECKVHLHVDTGMNTYGAPHKEALALARQIASSPRLRLEGVMTHFTSAEEPAADETTLKQKLLFDRTLASLEKEGLSPRWTHASNSSAVLRFPRFSYSMVRIGLAFYGATLTEACRSALPLQCAVTLSSRITFVRQVEEGEALSYGGSYRARRPEERIALVPLGYHDGIHKHYSNRGTLLIHGKSAPIVGTIAMDFLLADVTEIPEAKVGSEVLFFGRDKEGHFRPPESFAKEGGTHVHELLATLGPRIKRELHGSLPASIDLGPIKTQRLYQR